MDAIDWRAQLQPVIRQRKVNEIMSKLAKHHPVPDDNELLEVRKIARSFERKTYACAISQVDYLQKISFMMSPFEAQRQEEVYQKIKILKEAYLPELNEMYQKISAELQQHDSLQQQSRSEKLEKLKLFKMMLERIISFLQISKSNILPNFGEKLRLYEKLIINFINTNKPEKAMSSPQPGQLPPPLSSFSSSSN